MPQWVWWKSNFGQPCAANAHGPPGETESAEPLPGVFRIPVKPNRVQWDFVRLKRFPRGSRHGPPIGSSGAQLADKVPNKVIVVKDIPRTKSGKIVELAVKNTIEGHNIKNKEALANPKALEQFKNLKELSN